MIPRSLSFFRRIHLRMDRPLSSKSKTSMTFRIEIWLDNQSDTISINFKIDLIFMSSTQHLRCLVDRDSVE